MLRLYDRGCMSDAYKVKISEVMSHKGCFSGKIGKELVEVISKTLEERLKKEKDNRTVKTPVLFLGSKDIIAF
ncbi:hypothetical protein CW706_05935 [Candidatus Bathyarchaeota archaeon]|nr:MAG: hypothetical protein CW706_05935 [Candidatus Bathyarchaeota archaeon]